MRGFYGTVYCPTEADISISAVNTGGSQKLPRNMRSLMILATIAKNCTYRVRPEGAQWPNALLFRKYILLHRKYGRVNRRDVMRVSVAELVGKERPWPFL